MGRLVYPLSNQDGCRPFTKDDFNNVDFENVTINESLMILVDRGTCTFVTKTKYVEQIGGSLAIIADSVDENSEKVYMIDDGKGHSIRTPAFFISKSEGQIFKDQLANSDEQVKLLASFDISSPDGRVYYDLYYQSPFDFIEWDIDELQKIH